MWFAPSSFLPSLKRAAQSFEPLAAMLYRTVAAPQAAQQPSARQAWRKQLFSVCTRTAAAEPKPPGQPKLLGSAAFTSVAAAQSWNTHYTRVRCPLMPMPLGEVFHGGAKLGDTYTCGSRAAAYGPCARQCAHACPAHCKAWSPRLYPEPWGAIARGA